MKFKKVDLDGPAWICGIYKIVFYEMKNDRLKYAAYYKPKGWHNWGNHVNQATPFYRTLTEAKKACENHQKESAGKEVYAR